MEMFLAAVCLSLFGLAVTCIAFGAAVGPEQSAPLEAAERKPAPAVSQARFFGKDDPVSVVTSPRVPIEALLAQIENHVRLEQAAAESFLESPTAALLHSRTMSPFVN